MGDIHMLQKFGQVEQFFEGLGKEQLSQLLDTLISIKYPAGSMIYNPESDKSIKLYIVKKGRVILYRLNSFGKQLVLGEFLPGDVFAPRSLFGQTPQRNFAQAVENTVVISMEGDQFLAYLKAHPDVMLKNLGILSQRVQYLEEYLVESSYSSSMVRTVHFLLNNANTATDTIATTHEQIGNTIGAVRQTVTENLSELRKQQLILTKRNKIIITDKAGLKKIIEGCDNNP